LQGEIFSSDDDEDEEDEEDDEQSGKEKEKAPGRPAKGSKKAITTKVSGEAWLELDHN
jgi:hypothetical protein